MSARTLLSCAEVAARLNMSLDWFYRNHARLSATRGFPTSVLGGRDARWDPIAIDRWLDAQMDATVTVTGTPVVWIDPTIAHDTAEADRRSAALANV
jgi:predicted DNA-binding transcriptional regulator AlpA